MSDGFQIEAYRNGRELLIVLRGRLVLRHCGDAKTRLISLFTPQVDQIYLYLGDLEFLDSAGLGVLVGLKMAANKNKAQLTFLSPPSRVEDIFRVSKLHTIFDIRTGSEADVVCAGLRKNDYCLWRDRKDSNQTAYKTDIPDTGGSAASGLTEFNASRETEFNVDRIKQLCDNAVEFIRQADYKRAIETYQEILQLDPNNMTALNNLGIVYEKRPEWYPLAVEVWQKVLRISESDNDQKHRLRAQKHLESVNQLIGGR